MKNTRFGVHRNMAFSQSQILQIPAKRCWNSLMQVFGLCYGKKSKMFAVRNFPAWIGGFNLDASKNVEFSSLKFLVKIFAFFPTFYLRTEDTGFMPFWKFALQFQSYNHKICRLKFLTQIWVVRPNEHSVHGSYPTFL